MLETVTAVRYVTPLREGGSLPGVVEADDLGTYVMKFRGAGQGIKVLVAEVIVTEIARLLQIPTPRLVRMELPAAIARYEADEEVQDLLNASVGSNLGVDLLPGALGYDGARPPTPAEAADIVWLDAFTANPDRTWANPNLLRWHSRTWAIDHGAALYFHHSWPSRAPNAGRFARQPFTVTGHVLERVAGDLHAADDRARQVLTPQVLRDVIARVPGDWLETTEGLADAEAVRAAYLEHLTLRLQEPAAWLPQGAR